MTRGGGEAKGREDGGLGDGEGVAEGDSEAGEGSEAEEWEEQEGSRGEDEGFSCTISDTHRLGGSEPGCRPRLLAVTQ